MSGTETERIGRSDARRRGCPGEDTSPRFHSPDHGTLDALNDAVRVVVDLERGPGGSVVENATDATVWIAGVCTWAVGGEGAEMHRKRWAVGFVGRTEKPQDITLWQSGVDTCQAVAVALEGDEIRREEGESAEGEDC